MSPYLAGVEVHEHGAQRHLHGRSARVMLLRRQQLAATATDTTRLHLHLNLHHLSCHVYLTK